MSKVTNTSKDASTNVKKPILTLVPDEDLEELTKSNSREFQLMIDPSNAKDSAKYKVNVRVLSGSGERVRTLLHWYQDVQNVLVGHGATSYEAQKRLTSSLLRGNCLSLFNSSLEANAQARMESRAEAAYHNNAGSEMDKIAAKQAILDRGPQPDDDHIIEDIRFGH